MTDASIPKPSSISIFEAAVAAADPERTIQDHLPAEPKGRTIVIGAGKGSAQMAAAFEKAWDGPLGAGRHPLRLWRAAASASRSSRRRIRCRTPPGSKPSRRLLDTVSGLTADDLVVALISGGGSALLPSPAGRPDAGRRDRRQPGAARLRRADRGDEHGPQACLDHQGRPAGRRRLSGAGGVAGRLGHSRRQSGAGRVRADRAGCRHRADALASIAAYGMELPDAVMAHLELARRRCAAVPTIRALPATKCMLIASAAVSLEAAAAEARRRASKRSSCRIPSRARRARSAACMRRSPARSRRATGRSRSRC